MLLQSWSIHLPFLTGWQTAFKSLSQTKAEVGVGMAWCCLPSVSSLGESWRMAVARLSYCQAQDIDLVGGNSRDQWQWWPQWPVTSGNHRPVAVWLWYCDLSHHSHLPHHHPLQFSYTPALMCKSRIWRKIILCFLLFRLLYTFLMPIVATKLLFFPTAPSQFQCFSSCHVFQLIIFISIEAWTKSGST